MPLDQATETVESNNTTTEESLFLPVDSVVVEYYVLKVGSLYLEDVWEEHEEDINYSFTNKLSGARVFHRFQLDSDYNGAPKYLWDEVNENAIRTVDDMCDYFKGTMVKVHKDITWKEEVV